MRRLLSASFRNRLFAALLAASLIPLLLCSALLLQIFRLRMEDRAQGEADGYLDSVGQTLDQACRSFSSAAAALERDGVLSQALLQGSPSQGEVYRLFLEDVQSAQTLARLDLYDSQGNWYCSTRSAAGRSLSPQWGVLYQARERVALTFVAPEDPGTSNSPVLVGAAPLAGPDGAALGFLLVSFYQSDLHRLLDGAVGDSCDLLLLSPYWRAVYCSQPALADSLADDLRRRLLDGEPLSGAGEEFSYPVVQDEATGLYVILRQPQVFDRGTMNILYTISLSSALVCLALAVQPLVCLGVQLIVPGQPKPDHVVSTLLQVQAISAAGRVGQQHIDFPGIPVIFVLRRLQFPDPEVFPSQRLQDPFPVMLVIVKHQCRFPLQAFDQFQKRLDLAAVDLMDLSVLIVNCPIGQLQKLIA